MIRQFQSLVDSCGGIVEVLALAAKYIEEEPYEGGHAWLDELVPRMDDTGSAIVLITRESVTEDTHFAVEMRACSRELVALSERIRLAQHRRKR